MSECIRQIELIFSDVLLRQVESPQTNLVEAGILDSFALVELLLNIEQKFGLTIDIGDLDLDVFQSIESIAQLVASRQEQATNAGTR